MTAADSCAACMSSSRPSSSTTRALPSTYSTCGHVGFKVGFNIGLVVGFNVGFREGFKIGFRVTKD